jgi:hypothetical protein
MMILLADVLMNAAHDDADGGGSWHGPRGQAALEGTCGRQMGNIWRAGLTIEQCM